MRVLNTSGPGYTKRFDVACIVETLYINWHSDIENSTCHLKITFNCKHVFSSPVACVNLIPHVYSVNCLM
jgi:hypothetical protein